MTDCERYSPGPANGAKIEKDSDEWMLVLVRDLRHSPEKVWQAITDPKQMSAWCPFDSDRNLNSIGPVNLTTIGAPMSAVSQSYVIRADAPKLLELKWGDNDTRWELEATDQGTRLTLLAKIDRRYIAMGAAGWHVCLDVMEKLLDGTPIGRIAGSEAMQFEGWQRLRKDYSEQFALSEPDWKGGEQS